MFLHHKFLAAFLIKLKGTLTQQWWANTDDTMRACVYEGEEGGGRDGGEGYGLEGRDLLAPIEQLKQ